jgi:hypothetical protein
MNRTHPTNDIRTDNAATDQANLLMTQRGAIDWSALGGEMPYDLESSPPRTSWAAPAITIAPTIALTSTAWANTAALVPGRSGCSWNQAAAATTTRARPPPKPPGLVRSPPARGDRSSPFAVVASPGGYVRGAPPAASLADFPVIPRGRGEPFSVRRVH